ncbi:hypothetical protein GCM10025876_32340 [Demequina litorisediminis]|uniref:Major Facilitator Superfamily protein n=1 Tax=Demequina litorisediminis TaxID=1849022 RepID=A0ABQ6IGL3_9MICO|nr:hypothetical protein GCM10025876_32340 [Demequina litorisediminis]
MSESAMPSAATAPTEPDRRHILLMFVGLMTAMLLSALDQTIFATALPTVVGDLNGVDHMLWVTTAYILAATIMMPIYGKARRPHRPQIAVHDRDLAVHRRFGDRRARTGHDRTHRGPRRAGARRRWPHDSVAGDHRRRGARA